MKHDTGLLILRIGLGILFLFSGFGKLTGILGPGISGFAAMVYGSLILAWLVALGEFFGAISLLTGIWTKWSTIWLSVIMLGAIFIVNIPALSDLNNPMGFGGLLMNLSVLTSLLALMLTGPGQYSFGKA